MSGHSPQTKSSRFKDSFAGRVFFCALFILIIAQSAFAGKAYQDFEDGNGTLDAYGFPHTDWNYYVEAGRSQPGDPVHAGERSWKQYAPWSKWNISYVEPQTPFGGIGFDPALNDRFTFWIFPEPTWTYIFSTGPGSVTPMVRFFDDGNYPKGAPGEWWLTGFEVAATHPAPRGQWSKVEILISQLPPDFNVNNVTRIAFNNYWEGTYSYDDVRFEAGDRIYQSFNANPYTADVGDYAWKWNDADTLEISDPGEPAVEGQSLRLQAQGNWSGFGVKSQEKRFDTDGTHTWQTQWRVDFNATMNDRLSLWVYPLAQNGLDNNLNVQFYDNTLHASDETKVENWTREVAAYGEWTRIEIPFADLDPTLDLADLNKLQVQFYWPGTYYVDDIRATRKILTIDPIALAGGNVTWDTAPGAADYELEQSVDGPGGPWTNVYDGSGTSYQSDRLSETWFRARWKEESTADAPFPYISDWSDVERYRPEPVLVDKEALSGGKLQWSAPSAATHFEVESSPQKEGPWTALYSGRPRTLFSTDGTWYRVRAVAGQDVSAWSPPQSYTPGAGFIKAVGTELIELDGNGDAVVLKGVNLGSLFVIEDWMSGFAYNGESPLDDWTIRETLSDRFGEESAEDLLQTYRNNWISEYDLNEMMDLGVSLVRIPIYYRNFQDENGNWITTGSTGGSGKPNKPPKNSDGAKVNPDKGGKGAVNKVSIDFSELDQLIRALGDRGIYVLIDLHGAPGAQSKEFHTGRKDHNKLFENSPEGADYRARTVEFWTEFAKHYKDNTTVMGYDLLNEPTGTLDHYTPSVPPTPEDPFRPLWQLYDEIYDAVRAEDPNHVIVMEAVWDWDALPDPADYGWTNVCYQFHYYLFDHYDDIPAHEAFIDEKVAGAAAHQPQYNVPVMIGEFSGFSQRGIWEYYLETFNRQKWSWTMWSFKVQGYPSDWGLYNQEGYTDEPINIDTDDFSAIEAKLAQYTNGYFVRKRALWNLVRDYIKYLPSPLPVITSVTPQSVMVGEELTITGYQFGETQGAGSATFAARDMQVNSWSDSEIKAVIVDTGGSINSALRVTTAAGTSNTVLVSVVGQPYINSLGVDEATQELVINGGRFGDAPGEVKFVEGGSYYTAPISQWSDSQVYVAVPFGLDDADFVGVLTDHGYVYYPMTVDLPPYVAAYATQYNGTAFVPVSAIEANSAVWFHARGADQGYPIYAGEGNDEPILYVWDFSDGTDPGPSAFEAEPEHFFDGTGPYFPQVGVVDNAGNISIVEVPLVVNGVNDPPVVQINVDGAPVSGELTISAGDTLQFEAVLTDPNGDDTLGYPIFFWQGDMTEVRQLWDFGDGADAGSSAFAAAPQHTYSTPGNYFVTLTAYDNPGASAYETVIVHVE